ncbi:hypothetical protein Y032_0822g2536 [Ancylostoma ceylanicum]|uniref:Uncharacterized protein n=1 Tax=Ancylostoma ceylanicum TaxID=53326 RepID=A0A016WBZ3_9BILA|nr:hypothetical protein Y032_0822g2536 [Ancylostoma ceylanicum]
MAQCSAQHNEKCHNDWKEWDGSVDHGDLEVRAPLGRNGQVFRDQVGQTNANGANELAVDVIECIEMEVVTWVQRAYACGAVA